ncbi:MAG TPA: Dabb family protein [Methylomusa anaerophila]|uniref:Stress responsive A/B Barrel Domain protein n=1 Tax=Methylomusa anaerophila TaxID=1930071 RepID=A0A348AHX6_9FIRM|nr:Dabb family protein [Methylomusa anaerophila]BBB90674.1 stress responsive A/B Barrel Domain protein [Methylomusa anaerophila]HML88719.1 Dabb family protein [Methylomusa anaerophila]
MITNTQMLKFKDRSSETIAKARDVLLSMQGKIEFLRDLKVEANIRQGASSYDLLMSAQYDSLEDLEAYIIHPVHVEVAKYIASVLESSAVVCYES